MMIYRTRARFLGVESKTASGLTLHHPRGKESLDAPGQLVGIDMSKEGSPLCLPDGVPTTVRRIGAEAVRASSWEADPLSAQALETLIAEADAAVLSCANDSYKRVWEFIKKEVADGNAEFQLFSPKARPLDGAHIYRQSLCSHCPALCPNTAEACELTPPPRPWHQGGLQEGRLRRTHARREPPTRVRATDEGE